MTAFLTQAFVLVRYKYGFDIDSDKRAGPFSSTSIPPSVHSYHPPFFLLICSFSLLLSSPFLPLPIFPPSLPTHLPFTPAVFMGGSYAFGQPKMYIRRVWSNLRELISDAHPVAAGKGAREGGRPGRHFAGGDI